MEKFKFKNKSFTNNYWENCKALSLPHILIDNKIKFAEVSFDVFPMLSNCDLDADPSDFLTQYYIKYAASSNLPLNHFKCLGGSISLNFTVWKEDAPAFANLIYDFLIKFVKQHRVAVSPKV